MIETYLLPIFPELTSLTVEFRALISFSVLIVLISIVKCIILEFLRRKEY